MRSIIESLKSSKVRTVAFVVCGVILGLIGILQYNSFVLNMWWPEYVEKNVDQGIEFVAMTRNDTSSTFPDIEISHEYRLFAKRKWYYPYDILLDDDFFFDQDSIPASSFVPYARVFNFDGTNYIAVFEKILDREHYTNHEKLQMNNRLSKIFIFADNQRKGEGVYYSKITDTSNCRVDSVLSASKDKMMNVKALLHQLGQDTTCIQRIIDFYFPNMK